MGNSMTNRIDLKRAFLAGLTAAAVVLALVLVAGGSLASATPSSPAVECASDEWNGEWW